MTDFPADAPDIIARLDAMPPEYAADIVERGITSAVQARALEEAADLLGLMCRYDPRRAARLRELMLDACHGRITITLETNG